MITLETEYGRFEAATEKEVLRLARKAKKKWEEDQKKAQESKELAYLCAESNAFRMMRHHAGEFARLEFVKPDYEYFPWDRKHPQTIRIEGVYGTGYAKFSSSFIVRGAVMDNAGFAVGLIIDEGTTVKCYAVGAYRDQAAMVTVPIPPEDVMTWSYS